MKFNLNQRSLPPPSSAVFDASTITSVFERLHDLLDKFQGRSTPPTENVSSVRRSPTAGPSDNARPNPLTQVTDSAPQSPGAAPGPSKAMHVPPARGPSHHAAQRFGELPSARVEKDDWEPIRTGSLRDSSPVRLRSSLELVHTKITQHREIIDFTLSRGMSPPSHYYRDLDVLYAEYDHLCQSLESRQASASRRHGDSPVVAPPDVASPAAAPRPPRPDSSSRTGLRHSPQPGPSSSRDQRFNSQERPRPRDVSSDRSHHRGISGDAHVSDSSLAISLATDGDSLQGIPPLPSVADSLQIIPLRLSIGIHHVPLLVMLHLRDPHHGLLLPIHLLLPGKIRTLMIPPSLPLFGR